MGIFHQNVVISRKCQNCQNPALNTVRNGQVFRDTTSGTTKTTDSHRLWTPQIPTLPRGLRGKVQNVLNFREFHEKQWILVILDTFLEFQPLLRSVLSVLPGQEGPKTAKKQQKQSKSLSKPRGICQNWQNCKNHCFMTFSLKTTVFLAKWPLWLKSSLKHGQN